MIWVALFSLAAGQPSDAAPPAATPQVYEAEFAPLHRGEKEYANLGPVGPYYPDRYARMRLNGEAILKCEAAEAGVLKGCGVASATQIEFGLAARMLAYRKRITAAGSPSPGETIFVRVPFIIGAPVAVEP